MTGDDFSFDFPEAGPGRYRLQVQRESAIEAVSSPIWVEPPGLRRARAARPRCGSRWSPPTAPCDGAEPRSTARRSRSAPARPPAPESPALTVGTPDANGAARRPRSRAHGLAVRPGDPRTSADEADVDGDRHSRATCASGRPSRTTPASSTARVSLRITDRGSATLPGGGDEPATVTDMPLEIPVQCAATPGGAGGDVLDVDHGRRADPRGRRGGTAGDLGVRAGGGCWARTGARSCARACSRPDIELRSWLGGRGGGTAAERLRRQHVTRPRRHLGPAPGLPVRAHACLPPGDRHHPAQARAGCRRSRPAAHAPLAAARVARSSGSASASRCNPARRGSRGPPSARPRGR